MTVVFDAQRIPEADRAEVVHETVAQGFSPVDIEFAHDRGPVTASFALTDWGDLSVCSSVSTAVILRRTAALARHDAVPSIFLAMQMAGSAVLVQHDRQVVLRPGDLAVYDSATPWVMSDDGGMRQHKFRIPLDRMTLSYDVIRKVCAVSLCPGDPIADLADHYFRRLATQQTSLDALGGDVVSRPSIELLRAVITTHVDAAASARESLHSTLCARIMTYVRAHLRDLDLSPEKIAAEHHISLRLLYKVLAAERISLAEWLREHRLEGCRKELANSEFRDPIAVIARRWGFVNAASFSRMFRAEFGMSPREWRELNRAPSRQLRIARRETPASERSGGTSTASDNRPV